MCPSSMTPPGASEGRKPVRIQRSRAKGSKLVSPNSLPVVCVTRGTKWGNPFRIGIESKDDREAVAKFIAANDNPATRSQIRRDLAGKNLACWCPCAAAYCHADWLLKIASETLVI